MPFIIISKSWPLYAAIVFSRSLMYLTIQSHIIASIPEKSHVSLVTDSFVHL